MNLNFETTSDWSDEARFLDEVRDVGLKDEGRLTYHEMLIAYRRSQARVHENLRTHTQNYGFFDVHKK